MVVSKLSVINAMENLPVCTQEAAFILCVSPECADMVAMQVPEGTKITGLSKLCGSRVF